MRVELIYAPGCNTVRRALDVLETVIAEERLPIPVELTERASHSYAPMIRINGDELGEPSHQFEGDPCFLSSSSTLVGSGMPCVEQLRDLLTRKWSELTAI